MHAVVVGHLQNAIAEQRADHVLGLWALHLDRVHGRVSDLDVHLRAPGDPSRPEAGVAVRKREPEGLLGDAQQHGIVDDPAVGTDQGCVLALTHGALGEIAAGQQVGEVERVGALDLDDVLDADVPEGDVLEQVPVLGDRVVVVGREEGVVVHVVRRAPRPQGRLEVRGSRVPGPEVKGGRIRDRSCVGGSGHGRAAPLLYLSSLGLNPALVSPISRWGVARRRRVRPIGPRKRRHLGAQSDLVGQYPPDLGAGPFQRNHRIADQRPNPEPVEHRQQPVGERVWGGVGELAGRRAAPSQS